MKDFKSDVAWYGFPYNSGFTNDTTPEPHIRELSVSILMIHGSRDMASPVTNIYNYSKELDTADKYFELKVYQGKPNGFMIANGSPVREDFADNAYAEMIRFFQRKL